MGLFSALTGKVYRFNSINIPIDNGIATRIKEIDEVAEAAEKLFLAMAFDVAQKMVGQIFYLDHEIFKKSLDSLTKESLEKIYYILLDLSVSVIIQIPSIKVNIDLKKNIILNLAKISGSTIDNKTEDIANYMEANSGVMKAYENICFVLGRQEDSQSAILFCATFLRIHNEAMTKLGDLLYNSRGD